METALLEPVETTPNMEVMHRADGLTIWSEFRAKVEKIKLTAETLTVTASDQKSEMKLARATRLTLREIRIEIDRRRKELKEAHLRETQRIDSAAKELREIIEPLEERLLEQEQFAEREEAARIARLTDERTAELQSVGAFVPPAVGAMPDADYAAMLEGATLAKAAKEEAARRAEEERLAKEKAEAEERERIRQENITLKAEAQAKEQAAQKEREAAAAEQRRIQAEAREKTEREKAEQEAARQAAAAPDKEKLRAFAATVRALVVPTVSQASQATADHIAQKTAAFANWIETQAAAL